MISDQLTNAMECSLELLCALIIVRGVSGDQVETILTHPIPIADYHRAVEITNAARIPRSIPVLAKNSLIDFERTALDAKYATQVRESIERTDSGMVGDLVRQFEGKNFALTMNPNGCRVIQQLLQVTAVHAPGLVRNIYHPELSERAMEVSLDVNGNHVIQQCVELMPMDAVNLLVDSILGDRIENSVRLASHAYGCRVLQRLITKFGSAADSLCSDPRIILVLTDHIYGNYVIQHIIKCGRKEDREKISLAISSSPDIIRLGCSKYSSNVVDKAIRHGDVLSAKMLMNTIILSLDPLTGQPGLITLMQDKYGNYVVKAIIEDTRAELANEVNLVWRLITSHATILKQSKYSWHLVERVGKYSAMGG
jgi:pumilio RNA-binding family